MGWLDRYFPPERILSVGGGVSRLRTDDTVGRALPLVMAVAIKENQDLTEAILLNEKTGTVSSFKKFNRYAKNNSLVGLPNTTLVGSSFNLSLIAEIVRTDIAQTYPLANGILNSDVSSGVLTAATHHKFILQTQKDYNLTTNIFKHNSIDYYLTGYTPIVNPTGGFTGGFPTYEQTEDGTQYQIGYNNLVAAPITTGYTITGTKVSDGTPISFTITAELPPTYTYVWRDYFYQEVLNDYWTVYYTYSGRKYIWLKQKSSLNIFSTISLSANNTNTPELQFAPIIKLRDNKVKVTPATELHRQTSKVLKTLNLDVDAINDAITDGYVEDVAVLLTSNLISTHMDQLAYNYAFFESMAKYTSISSISSDPNSTEGTRLAISKDGVFANSVNWVYINKTIDNIGVLTSDYQYEIQNNTLIYSFDSDGGILSSGPDNLYCDYIIRKKTSSTTYDEIYVTGLNTSYVVIASENDAARFSVEMTAASGAQLVIPFSYEIANKVPKKYLETLYLRCLHIVVFSKAVSYVKWYQSTFFQFFMLVVIVVITIYNAPAGASLSTALLYIAKIVVMQYVLKQLLTKALEDGNKYIQAVAVIAYVVAQVYFFSGDNTGWLQNTSMIITSANALVTADNILIQLEAEALLEEQIALDLDLARFDSLFEEMKEDQLNQEAAERYLKISNLFRKFGEFPISLLDAQLEQFNADISEQSDLIKEFYDNSLLLPEVTSSVVESPTLV